MDRFVSTSKGTPSLETLDRQMKELLAALQKNNAVNYKERAFYEDAVSIKRLKVKLAQEGEQWNLYMMMPNDFKPKAGGSQQSFAPSVIVLPSSDLKEFCHILQGLSLEILTHPNKGEDLPRIRNSFHGKEATPKQEEFWHKDFTSAFGSGNLLLRPWRVNSTHFVRMLSPRPPSTEYEWLGVQMTLFVEEAVGLCSHIKEFLLELQLKGVSI